MQRVKDVVRLLLSVLDGDGRVKLLLSDTVACRIVEGASLDYDSRLLLGRC